jgi:hypothetical protein
MLEVVPVIEVLAGPFAVVQRPGDPVTLELPAISRNRDRRH